MRQHRSRSFLWAFVIFVVALGPWRAEASFIVTTLNPPNNSLVEPFSSITVDFSQTVNPASLSDSDLTVNGVNATGFSVLTGTEVSFTVAAGAIPSGERAINTISVSGIQDSANETLTPFSETVVTDNVAPFVVANSIGKNFTLVSPNPLTDVLTFSEPMNTAFTTAGSFDLHGVNHHVNYVPASFSWDPTGTILTINYASLPADQYGLTLFSNGFADLVGLDLSCGASSSAVGCAAAPPVPEPSSLALLAGGLLALFALRRRVA